VFLFTIYVSLRIVTLFNGAWTVAWYAFDPLWTLRRWPLSRRLSHFESKWAYYAGFGMPAAIAGAAIPGLAGSGLWSLVFPVFVITAVYANPRGIMAKK
jgi:etoposide-induced 2.4 mRNA